MPADAPAQFTLCELGWQPHFDQQISVEESAQFLVARVHAHHGGQIIFRSEEKEFAVPTSIVEPPTDSNYSSIAVGDWFLLQPDNHRAVRRLERKTVIARKAAGESVKPQLIAANVDTVFVVSSCNEDFNLSRIERYLAMALESDAVPVIVLTKADLAESPALLRVQTERLRPGIVVETIDARDARQTKVLEMWCETGKTIALLGSSGVGKSTLANALGNHNIETAAIRQDDDKGRHTTTARSMHRLNAGGWLIDNPGMREFQLPSCDKGVSELFDEVVTIASRCKFRNCKHQGDPGCALEQAVASGVLEQRRLTNYLKLQSEQARNGQSLAERREKDRQTGKLYKSVIQEKKSRRN